MSKSSMMLNKRIAEQLETAKSNINFAYATYKKIFGRMPEPGENIDYVAGISEKEGQRLERKVDIAGSIATKNLQRVEAMMARVDYVPNAALKAKYKRLAAKWFL